MLLILTGLTKLLCLKLNLCKLLRLFMLSWNLNSKELIREISLLVVPVIAPPSLTNV